MIERDVLGRLEEWLKIDPDADLIREAADEIRRLREENERLRSDAVSSIMEPCTVHETFEPGCVRCVYRKACEADQAKADGREEGERLGYAKAVSRTIKLCHIRARGIVTWSKSTKTAPTESQALDIANELRRRAKGESDDD